MLVPPGFERWLEQLLHTHDTPQRTAAAYALGVFFGFSPLLGLHTVLGLALAFVFNLNRVAVAARGLLEPAWILPAYYTAGDAGSARPSCGVEVPPGLLEALRDALTDAVVGRVPPAGRTR